MMLFYRGLDDVCEKNNQLFFFLAKFAQIRKI